MWLPRHEFYCEWGWNEIILFFMKLNRLQKKLLKTAVYTSPVIGVVGITPVFIAHSHSFVVFQVGLLLITALVFCIWMINIGMTGFYEQQFSGKNSNRLRYLLSFLFIFLFILFLKHALGPYIHAEPDPSYADYTKPEYYYPFIAGFALNTVVLIIQDLKLLQEKKSLIELENARLKLRNAEAMNQKLKQQIHPHFLFNSLNTLKVLTKKHPATAADYVGRLSGFLRSALSSADINTVRLGEELKLCTDYLEMQKIRFDEALQYKADVPGAIQEAGFVPPFSVQFLLENAIKHNAMSRESPLYIEIQVEDGWIKVSNNRQRRNTSEPSTGMGMDNLAERYRLLSGDEIVVDQTGERFSVSIKILRQSSARSPEGNGVLSDRLKQRTHR
jgi:two-component system, LytTR family, sensor kinase